MVRLKRKPFDIYLIQGYAPTWDYTDDQVEEENTIQSVYDSLSVAIKEASIEVQAKRSLHECTSVIYLHTLQNYFLFYCWLLAGAETYFTSSEI